MDSIFSYVPCTWKSKNEEEITVTGRRHKKWAEKPERKKEG
jgi:hypothetical protein